MAIPDVLEFRHIAILKIHALGSAQMTNGKDRAFSSGNKRPDLGDQRVQVLGVLRQAGANNRQVIQENELATQRPNHVAHPLQDRFFIKGSEVIK